MRTPDEIMADFDAGSKGLADIDMRGVLWEIIEDILSSVNLAETEMLLAYVENKDVLYSEDPPNIYATVQDYVVNHYGDD